MHKALLIAAREYGGAVRTKSFLIMVVIMPILMGGGLIAMKLMDKGRDLSDERIAVVDHTGRIGQAIVAAADERNKTWIHDPKTGKQTLPAYRVEIVPPAADAQAQRVALSEQVRRKQLFAFVEIGPDVVRPGQNRDSARIEYHSENPALDDVRRWLDQPINARIRMLRLKDLGIDQAAASRVFDQIPVEGLGLVTLNAQTGKVQEAKPINEGEAIGIPAAAMALMLMMTMIGSTPLVNVILEEKMQRIAEVMLGSVPPFQFMLGKLVGMVGVSLTVSAIYMGVGLYAAYYYDVTQYIPYHLVPWFLAYMVVAILMFGSLMAAMGAACNDMKEAQSVMMPVILVLIVPTFIWFNVAREPLSSFSTALSFVPLFTPILMMVRLASPTPIPAWQPWAGLAAVVACAILCIWLGGRIFRVGLLMQGKPPRLRDLARWAFAG
jgi:ABC-2 type transport system permease protein